MKLWNKISDQNSSRDGRMKNQLLLKRGSFALTTVVLLIAAIIVINAFAVPVLSERFHMNWDFSKDHIASLSEDNIKYIKGIKEPVTITVTCPEDQYSYYMQNVTYQNAYYSAAISDTDSFDQTVTLIKKYHEYNKKITVKFAKESEISKLAQQYNGKGLQTIGDIIITADERKDSVKVLNYGDIYTDNAMAFMQGQATEYSISENKVETAVSGAIYDLLGGETEKIVLYTRGDQMAAELATYLSETLTENKYSVETNSDYPIKEIGEDVSLAVLMPSQVDLIPTEKELLSEYLETDGTKVHHLACYGTATFDYDKLPTYKKLLAEWGITPENGMVIDMNGVYYSADYGILVSLPDYENTTKTGYLSTSTEAFTLNTEKLENISIADSVMSADGMSVVPFGSETASKKTGTYPVAVRLQKTQKTDDNEQVVSTLTLFSSFDFAYPDLFAAAGLECSNRELVLDYFGKAIGGEETQVIDFGFKNITAERFAPSEKEAGRVKAIFMWVIPLLAVAAGIFVYVWRRRSK